MNQHDARWIVISDLDGTILNHHDYDLEAARTTVVRCRELGIPVILNTSKTYTETLAIRDELGISDPFVVENGSCIYFPVDDDVDDDSGAVGKVRDDYREIVCGRSQADISRILESLQTPSSCYTRLSRCSVEQAVELTGLKPEQAENAIAREFSEPLIWRADAASLESFAGQLADRGLSTLQGGRFLHVIGQCDKGKASLAVAAEYGDNTRIIALGDSPNDAAMLDVADIACIVDSPSSEKLAQLVQADIITVMQAPEGWTEAVGKALDRALGIRHGN